MPKGRPKDPCQRQACAIQTCLTKNKFQEEKCHVELEQMIECCKTLGKDGNSYICKGMLDYDTSKATKSSYTDADN